MAGIRFTPPWRDGSKLGGAKDDISVLMTYVAHDVYLQACGRLGFVITQTVFKTKGGGEGFGSFTYQKNHENIYLVVLSAHDMSDLQPFEGATNFADAMYTVGKRNHQLT